MFSGVWADIAEVRSVDVCHWPGAVGQWVLDNMKMVRSLDAMKTMRCSNAMS